jgi:hypothetical protein
MAALPPEEFSRHKDALIVSKLSPDRSKPGRTRSMPAPPDDRQRPLESPRPACCSSSPSSARSGACWSPQGLPPTAASAPRRRPPTAAPSAQHPATHLLHYISSTCRQSPHPPPAAAACHHRRPPAPTSAALASASSRSDIPGGAGPASRPASQPAGQPASQPASQQSGRSGWSAASRRPLATRSCTKATWHHQLSSSRLAALLAAPSAGLPPSHAAARPRTAPALLPCADTPCRRCLATAPPTAAAGLLSAAPCRCCTAFPGAQVPWRCQGPGQ